MQKEGYKMAKCIDVRQIKNYIGPDAKAAVISSGDKKQKISLAYQRTGFGQKRYFMCPNCSKRVEHLYSVNDYWSCRKCSGVNPYYGIQNNTKGGYDEIGYRMRKYADVHDIQFEFPFDYLAFIYDDRVRKAKFRNNLLVLQSLESMRFHSLFFKVTYKPKAIRSIINVQHPLMRKVTLMDLQNNIYDWNSGQQIVLDDVALKSITR